MTAARRVCVTGATGKAGRATVRELRAHGYDAVATDTVHLANIPAPGRATPAVTFNANVDDGTPVGYAWGTGVRSHAGYRVYRHGGGWPGLRALLARVPDLNQSLVIMALTDDSERRVGLAASMLDVVTAPPPG